MTEDVPDLYDYAELRTTKEAAMFIVEASRPTLVLGSSQDLSILNSSALVDVQLRRRRGGGGLVLLRPGDLWVDWWLPPDDVRWSNDVRASALIVGRWWASALSPSTAEPVTVHEGPLEGEAAHRVVCFAGRGPGEVFVGGRKAVGLTQWRVREGAFFSTVLHGGPSTDVLRYLASAPVGLAASLDHHVLATLAIADPEAILGRLIPESGPWPGPPLALTV